MPPDMQILVDPGPNETTIEVLIADMARTAVAASMIMQEVEPGVNPAPTFTMTRDAAQHLFDRLHRMGFRPAEAERSSVHRQALDRQFVSDLAMMGAMGKHLDDLREILFRVLDVLAGTTANDCHRTNPPNPNA